MGTGHVTVVGGGLGGLTAAIATAEAGAEVTLHEAHGRLGGRGRALEGSYVAHEGAHVFYADGEHYRWLRSRGLIGRLGWPSAAAMGRVRFRVDDELRRIPPAGMLAAQAQAWRKAPVDETFGAWATGIWGERTTTWMANAISVVTYDAETTALSAAYVWDLFQRVLGPRIPAIRWVVGGWQAVIDRMAQRARELEVRIQTGSRVDALPTGRGPVIVATDQFAARGLLGDDSLGWPMGHAALLDIAVRPSRGDCSLVFDLDEGGFHESYSMQDSTVAPAGEALYQLQMPVRPDEGPSAAHERLARLAERALPGWRERATFTRTATARDRTGANDLPGYTWRDRPAIDRGDGVYLVGDTVAAPGMRGEIVINSAVEAARLATERIAEVAPH